MSCPECEGKLILEDKVLFCKDCLHTVSRNYERIDTLNCNAEQPKRKGRPISEKRQKGIACAMVRWEHGKMISHSPEGIKGTICISKTGKVYYRYHRHRHRYKVLKEEINRVQVMPCASGCR